MEEDVIILIKKFRVTNDNNYFNMIFQNLYPLMILKIKGIFREDREDAIQILSIELLDVVRNATLYESCFLDKKYFCDENEKLIKNRETSKIDQMFSTAFLEQYLISNPFQWELLEDAFHSTESFKKFNEQYSHYVCKIKILSLLLRKFSTAISKFQKKLRKEKYYEIVSLNEVNEYGNEFIDLIPNEDNQVINLEDFVFEDEDLEFLKMFIQDDELLSQSEVANKFKLANCLSIETFTYANEGWKDRLVSIEKKNQSQITNQVITYDKYGYPTNYKGTQLTWNKKGNLLAFGNNTYEYNYQGVRVSKTIGGEKTKFYVDGTKIIASITGSNRLLFHYAVDKLVGFKYNNNEYIYRRNIQGDITHIYLDDGTLVAEYKYDAFGNHTITNYTDENIGEVNPFRYRGYYYDTESDLFYLNSRYYDSKLGRFISPDALSILEETKGLINGLNLYMYCADNPVMYVDPTGRAWWEFWKWDWGAILDVAITIAAIVVGVIIGMQIGFVIGLICILFSTPAIIAGIAIGLLSTIATIATIGLINNTVNFLYYTFVSDGKTDIKNDSYNNAYISRWDRLDYTKQQTKETWFNTIAWRYYNEYNFHMYAWFILKPFYTGEKNPEGWAELADRAHEAHIKVNQWDSDGFVNVVSTMLGILGL